ncbi:cysteine desulfurase [Bacillus shivajii]|uniref:cysteine desulfurase family protein n=1 Tax=Bacillus shivajii TaxID=1983719 RepID=UPI001CFBC451|nr:cysteine desulfurase family protein [Bacillus shivajii]UCZ52292.1 cysteine desulfurase [Bacillus shivajii]
MIYFDNSATTKPFEEVVETYTKVATEYFGNPSSLHPLGKSAERLLVQSRDRMAKLLQVKPSEVLFTSGGTEGNNLSIKGTAKQLKNRGNHLITTNVEHASSIEAFRQLEREGFRVTYLKADHTGKVSKEQVASAITDETILVSMIHVNNELGSIQPIEEIGEVLKKYPKIIFHVDHVQGVGKVPLNFSHSLIDLCTLSAHKFHGMKGTGLLYIRDGVTVSPLLSGGSQERGFRAGTENVPGVVAMVKALRVCLDKSDDIKKIQHIKNEIRSFCQKVDGIVINSPEDGAPHILNLSVPKVKPEVVVQALAEKNIYVSTKSACSSKQSEPSHVLEAIGLSEEIASSAIRISLSYDNTIEEAKQFMVEFQEVASSLKKVVEKQ